MIGTFLLSCMGADYRRKVAWGLLSFIALIAWCHRGGRKESEALVLQISLANCFLGFSSQLSRFSFPSFVS
jgi:hypothetical protein